ncbi:MAG: hypothetical protein JNK09_11755 [Prolixibacteraceae bacterium]|nr:hypothetical protein [Prolixibacteraceae bacterium]
MKRYALITILLFSSLLGFSQAKKPTIMVIPSDNWCIKNGYVQSQDVMGTIKTFPDYKAAVQNDTELLMVLGKINTLMADRGFPLKNLESVLKTLETESAEVSMLTSKGGSDLAESPTDVLKRTANADIIIQITYVVNQNGPKRSITFMLQGLDAYTDKQIAGAQGTGQPSFATELTVLLEEAVISYIDDFNSRLQDHFNDLFTNGREVALQMRVFNGAAFDLEQEFNWKGETLECGEIVEDWVAANTVQGRYNLSDYSENRMIFEQVRIPLFDDRDRAMDTRRWVRDLRSMLTGPPFNIPVKIYTKGLGEVWLILGEK